MPYNSMRNFLFYKQGNEEDQKEDDYRYSSFIFKQEFVEQA